ncbi:AraC family transcriptional regulator [Paenibacillus phyllosphaerae]|uniref:AraC family transcriptional regulator n=1 Tax=Paenibacillus phyllosphaerae TaxID=274593 RepID=UPI00390831A7
MVEQEVAISMIYPIVKTIVHKGLEVEAFFDYAGFDSGLLQDPEARISGRELERLTIAAAAYTGDECFGLHQGQLMDIADMGILGYVMMHSQQVKDALAAYRRYNVILVNGFNLEWAEHGEAVRIRLYASNSAIRLSRHCIEDMAASLYRLMGKLSNRRIALHEVQFMHEAPAAIEPYRAAFGVTPRFGCGDNVLVLGKEVLEYPILYADPKLLVLFEQLADETKERLIHGNALSDQVFQWMMRCMPASFPTLQETAVNFNMSTRTLQSKLSEEQTSYNDLSARVRKELAVSYLGRNAHSVSEIAYLLHFSEPSAFQNAFKKWTGLTPGQYRSREIELKGS